MKTFQDSKANWFDRLVEWREKHVSERQLILFLALLVGIFTAFAGIVMKSLIHLIEELLTEHFDQLAFNWLYLIYPVIGI